MSTETPTIRHATREDVPEILAMINELAGYENALHEVHATPETLLNTLTFAPFDTPPTSTTPSSPRPARTLLLITSTNAVAGMALYFYNYSTWRSAPGIYLEDLFVRPEHRKKGYGKALLRALARETVAIGGARLEWSCLKWNGPSLGFYEALGAKQMGEWVGLRVDGEELGRLAEG